MTSLDKAIIASYDRGGRHFELYVDPDAAYAYLEKKKPDLKNILVAEEVYENAKKAERAKSADLEKAFGTTELIKILEIVLNNGEVQLTTEQRRKKVEERRKQIIAILLREAIDPRTKAPHTLQRIETALEEAKIHVDPFKDPREQLAEIVKKLIYVLPLKFDRVRVAVKIPAVFAHRCYGIVKSYGIQQEQWAKDGSLIVVVEIFAGMQGEFYDKLNKMTGGQIETRTIQ